MPDAITPDTIKSERFLAVPPDRVFRAWSDRDERLQWDVPGNNWIIDDFQHEFREDGIETSRFGPKGEPTAETFGRYLIIEPPRRIVNAGVMRSVKTGEVSSATMMTLNLEPEGDGTRLTLIDQSVFLGRGETATMRRHGWDEILDKLSDYLKK
jgi:uncharacterized protein YndB with AHSA1/START domain